MEAIRKSSGPLSYEGFHLTLEKRGSVQHVGVMNQAIHERNL